MNFIELTKNVIKAEKNKELQQLLARVLEATLLKRLFVGDAFDQIDDDNLSAKFLVAECCDFKSFAELEVIDAYNLLVWVENKLEGGKYK